MSLSENPNPGQSRVLDEVRAKIFYLASDVEPASEPAAMLLRAVAESIDTSEVDASEVADQLNGRGALKSETAPIAYHRVNGIHASPSRVRDAVPLSERHVGAESSRSGHKR
jgi:hypothetical protein